jgi:hypothetical protein
VEPYEGSAVFKAAAIIQALPIVLFVETAVGVRFELTEPFGSSVFEAGAINQTLPPYRIILAPQGRLERPTYRVTTDCSTIELLGILKVLCIRVPPVGIEPTATALEPQRSNPLSYRGMNGRVKRN